MFWFEAHTEPDWVTCIAYELAGRPTPIRVVTGKVKARTRWGARRLIKKLYRSSLLAIPYVGKKPPEGRQ